MNNKDNRVDFDVDTATSEMIHLSQQLLIESEADDFESLSGQFNVIDYCQYLDY